MFLYAVANAVAGYSEGFGGLGLIPSAAPEGIDDHRPFVRFQQRLVRSFLIASDKLTWKVLRVNTRTGPATFAPTAQQGRPLQDVLKLTDVPRKVVTHQQRHRLLRYLRDLLLHVLRQP